MPLRAFAADIVLPAPLLLVEDDIVVRRRLEDILLQFGYKPDAIIFAATLAEARACINEQPVALALVDIGLPDGSGIDLIAELHMLDPGVAILVISAWCKSGANLAGAQAIKNVLKITGTDKLIEILQVKYLNNILEQDHRFIKRVTKHMLGFKAFHSASATIAGIEVAHMIRKNQFANDDRSPFVVFAELAA